MAVPKQKHSKARRDKRRATHKLTAPNYNLCPQCHAPRMPHRVCPECGYYAKRQVVKPPTPALGQEEQSPQSQ